MSEALAGRDDVTHELLELLDVRETASLVARPEPRSADADLEHAARSRHQRDFTDIGLERREQLLRHPRRAQKPTTLRAIFDLDARVRCVAHRLSAARAGSPAR